MSAALADRGLGKRGPAWLAGRLYRKENQVLSWLVGAARPTIADIHDVARALDLDPAVLAAAAGVPPARPVGLETHTLAETICNWCALQGLDLARASTMLKTTPLTLAAWEQGRVPHVAGRHRLVEVVGRAVLAHHEPAEQPGRCAGGGAGGSACAHAAAGASSGHTICSIRAPPKQRVARS